MSIRRCENCTKWERVPSQNPTQLCTVGTCPVHGFTNYDASCASFDPIVIPIRADHRTPQED